MHDLTNPVRHADALRGAMHAEVDDLEPCDCLPHILDQARRTSPWAYAVVAGLLIGALLIVAGLLMLADHTPPSPPTTTLVEA